MNFLSLYCKHILKSDCGLLLSSVEQKIILPTDESIFFDRANVLFECLKNIFSSPKVASFSSCQTTILSPTYSSKFKTSVSSIFGSDKINYFEVTRGNLFDKSIKGFLVDVSYLLFFALCLLDKSRMRYHALAQGIRVVSALDIRKIQKISMFSTYDATMYSILLQVKNSTKISVYFSEGIMQSRAGNYLGCDLIFPNEVLIREMMCLQKNGFFKFDAENVKVNRSVARRVNKLNLTNNKQLTIGFFSDAWWLRHTETHYLHTEEKKIMEILKIVNKNRLHVFEKEMLQRLDKFCQLVKCNLKVYPHPSELKLGENCLRTIYGSYVTDGWFFKEKYHKFNDYNEPSIAITLTGLSSIITQRTSNNLPTVFLSNDFFCRQNLHLKYERAFIDKLMFQCESFEEVLSVVERHISISN